MFQGTDRGKIEKFTGNPDWQPPVENRSIALDGYSLFLKDKIKNIVFKNKTRQNISEIERKALEDLRSDKSILINKADKGGSIVIVNADDYLQKIELMLADTVTYTVTDSIDLDKAKIEVDNLLYNMQEDNLISKKQLKFFLRNKPKLPVLYGLAKIHKKNWPLRPIVSQIDSPCYNLSKYLDYLLTTAEKSIPYLLQDTTRFLQLIKTLPATLENTILFTIDVTSLYTVLPHKMVIEYVTEMYEETISNWNNFTPELRPVPDYVIKRILNTVLSQTFFSFNGKNYTQNYGITMGSSSSVKIANITLFKHLQKILPNYKGKLPDVQFRLIDDIFGTMHGTDIELHDFVEFLNNSHTSIKFTVESSKSEIPFLDTLVYIDNNKIKTRLYKKPTDNKQYLHYSSEHPTHMKNSIPYAQALRYRRIIEDDNILDLELSKLTDSFASRGYPERILNDAINRVLNLKRDDLINYKVKEVVTWNNTPLVLTFNNSLVNNKENTVYKLITESWADLIMTAPDLVNVAMPKVVFKRCQTISSLLVSAVYPPTRWNNLGQVRNNKIMFINDALPIPENIVLDLGFKSLRCNSGRCFVCQNLVQSTGFESTKFGTRFPLLEDITCNVSNCVYLITCKKCKLQYVGETGLPFRDRMSAHRSCVKLRKNTPVGIHFSSVGHKQTDMLILPIELLKTNNSRERKEREFFWQLKIGSIFPAGLNGYPVNDPNFINVKITSASDLELFWRVYTYNDESE